MKTPGRNEPCPCGSGKKFKHCHLGKEDQLQQDSLAHFSNEMSEAITRLPQVWYGRTREILDNLDIRTLTGVQGGIRFIDLNQYQELQFEARDALPPETRGRGSVLVNILKTRESDPGNVYVAISPDIEDSALIHQIAHVLDFLGGSRLMPGLAKPLSYDLGIPTEHLEHPHEFGYWLDWLQQTFQVRPDADDAIIGFLYEKNMLIKGADIQVQDRLLLKTKSDRIMKFLGENSAEIDDRIRELPGYIGSRLRED